MLFLRLLPKICKNETTKPNAKIRNIFDVKRQKTQTEIADAIGVNKSTISRELRRNGTDGRYHYTTAQELCDIRKERLKSPRKFNAEIKNRIDRKLRGEDWSSEQIEGWNGLHGYAMVSKRHDKNAPNATVKMLQMPR